MRAGLLILALLLAFGVETCRRAQPGNSSVSTSKFATGPASITTATKPDFGKQIKPILQSRCQPCHFQGGKVYAHLPFDRPETITKLGTKLFTRIKDEKEQRLIREFLATQ